MNTYFIYSHLFFITIGNCFKNINNINNINKRQLVINNNISPIIKKNILHNHNMPLLYSNNYYNNIYSIEHIYPISYLITNESKIDMHNLVKTTKDLNNARSNYKYTDFEEINFNINNKNWIKLDNNNYVNHKKKMFIPNNESKGIIARSILYINDKYNLEINKVINYSILINWYIYYPPDKYEIYHNNYVKNIQNTNNKFISNYKYYIKKIYKNIKINDNYYSNSL
tara:strand:- start:1636 stop:2316 length:681 start_codon:yes stop_codon:yes gene_type:complete